MNRHQRVRDEAITVARRRPGGGWRFHGNARSLQPAIQHFHPYSAGRAICGAWFYVTSGTPRPNSRVPRCQKCAAVVARAA